MMGHGSFSIWVIHKEGLCPSGGDIISLMMICANRLGKCSNGRSVGRDTNKDGHMDANEVKEWIAPPEFDHAEAEARHLVFEADADADERLSKAEVLAKYDLFVGSQATDFGEAFARHDEF
jgi:hypothetical protein